MIAPVDSELRCVPDRDRVAMALQDMQETAKSDMVVCIFNFFDELRRHAQEARR
jgi:hypothetical protein